MATRWWCLRTLTRRATTVLASHSLSQALVTRPLNAIGPNLHYAPRNLASTCQAQWPDTRYFSSTTSDNDKGDEDEVETSEDETLDAEAESAAIGYKVVGPVGESDRVFKPYEPVFAVVQVGSHQFKVSNGDSIYVERLKHCDVNDKLILNKVLLLGSSTQTIVGRPIVPDAAVHAVVEEHALDAKVIIFKKKRRKNYRRTKGHRQELTRLRITDIQGIEKPENKPAGKPLKATSKKPEKVAVAA